jgi:hypothetical protein
VNTIEESMKVIRHNLISMLGAAEETAPLLTWIAACWLADPHTVERRLTLTRPKPWPGARGWRHGFGASLAFWALACGAAVVVLHNAMSDLGPGLGAYRTGIATLVLFALAAVIIMHGRIGRALPHGFVHAASLHKLQQNPPSNNFSHALGTSRLKPKTWKRMHVAVAIGAMLPFWWHCDLGRASMVDLLLKSAAILLLMSGFLGVAITDLTRWQLLSPMFSPRLSAGFIRGFFIVHRGLALLAFMLITVHVIAVLYFAGV